MSSDTTKKLTIILKPEVLEQQKQNNISRKRKQRSVATKLAMNNPNATAAAILPDSLDIASLGQPNCKFNDKLRDVLDTLTFSIQDYIIHNLDNEATSDKYMTKLRDGLAKVRDDFIVTRCMTSTPAPQITQLSNK
jgi:predicted flavoprotein YhiN